MKVSLLSTTPRALDVLLFTKNTRLAMNGATLNDISAWPQEKKMAELEYMRNTIQSSWEFVDYVFAIEGVTRAFTQQLERHRIGTSFAEQSMRAVDMSGFEYLATGPLSAQHPHDAQSATRSTKSWIPDQGAHPANRYDDVMRDIEVAYTDMLSVGTPVQDARGVLPMNILTNIVFKANLRTLHEMGLKRLCVRTQGEFQDVFRAILDAVTIVHPWAEQFIRVQCAWNGTCLFPLLPLDKCHVKPWVYDPVTARAYSGSHPATLAQIYQLHRGERRAVQPDTVKKS